jgi:hypothetical protein
LRHEAVVAEIMAHGGPQDEIERMFCESLSPPRVQPGGGAPQDEQ